MGLPEIRIVCIKVLSAYVAVIPNKIGKYTVYKS